MARQLPGLAAPSASEPATDPIGPVRDVNDEEDDDEEPAGQSAAGTLKARLEAAEKHAIEDALKLGGSVAKAAELLDLERSHLYKKLRKHRLPY